MPDPTRCPGGGCKLDGRMGTCGIMRQGREQWRWCRGWAAYVCPAAIAKWEEAGRPVLPDAVIQQVTARPALPPDLQHAIDDRVARQVREAPYALEAWTIYAPHEPNSRGGYHDEAQADCVSLMRSFDVCWRAHHAPDLVVLGREGTGKTFLTLMLGRRAAAYGWTVGFVLWSELVEAVKATRAGGPDRMHDVLEPVRSVDLLLLDDVRPIYGSQDDENIAHVLTTARHGRDRFERHQPTFVTANLTRSELADVIGPAALSRLLDGGLEPLVCDWPSWRSLPRPLHEEHEEVVP